ncbi:E3 ubiquitin-protein ligase MBR2-like [Iris pallida]|uniref:RING-type E3 ubiquitin transferase n=1 Tax=Iris pallida TaxID=29817 RepID=A0AAX6GJF4_IRIPA|nr:E3 ubiquitin-protein ligase MBR2-like [Iris pallida]
MDEYTNKLSGGGLGFSARGSNLTLRDPNHDGKGTQYCNRLGCSTRLKSMRSTSIGSAEKPKPKTSLCTTSSKINAGNKTFSSPTDFRKSQQEKQVRTPLRNTAENSSRQRVAEGIKSSAEEVETEASEFIQPTTSKTALSKLEGPESPDLQVLSTIQTEAPTSRPQKQINRRLGSFSQDTPSSSSSIRRSVASRSTGQVTKPCSQYLGSGPPRYGVKNLNCSSISDVLPSGRSSSNLSNSRKVASVRKRPSDEESSSSGGKSTSGSSISSLSASSGSLSNSRKVTSVRKRPSDEESSSSGGKSTSGSSISSLSASSGSLSNSRKVTSVRKRSSDEETTSSSGGKSTSGSSISSLSASSGSLMPQQSIRRAKIQPTSRDAPVSVRTRRAPVRESRKRLPEQQNDNSVSISEPIIYLQQPQSQLSILEPVSGSSSRSCPTEAPPVDHNSLGGQPSSIARSARSRPLSSYPANNSRHGPLRDRDGYRRFNMDGIAEQVLLALERIEQDDELTYEQLMVLETNLFLGGSSFHDQHRDMRLDIDNMTYEELLALEDKMGTVSTALSEELLSKCLKRSIYVPCSHLPGITTCREDDTKCSICQEEYVAGEEIGKLACDHHYHVDCINQWLRQKNWCPICKTSVVSPSDERNSRE